MRRDRHLKLGKGGLSDVEWTIQLLQLQHAGDNANLRVNGTMQALDELERRKLVSAGDAVVLRKRMVDVHGRAQRQLPVERARQPGGYPAG